MSNASAEKPNKPYSHEIKVDGGLPIGCYEDERIAGAWMNLPHAGYAQPSLMINSVKFGQQTVQNYVGYDDGRTSLYGAHKLAVSVEQDGAIRVQIVTTDSEGFHKVNLLSITELENIVASHHKQVTPPPVYS